MANRKWARCANCGKATWYCAKHGCKPQEENKMANKKETAKPLSIPEKHQLRVAQDTLKMPDAMLAVMGGPSKAEAMAIIIKLTGKAPRIY